MSQQLHSSQRDNSAAINSEFAGSIKEMRHQSCIIIFLRGIALRVREQRPSECRIPVVHPTLRHEKCTIVEYGMSGSGLRTIDTITSEKVMWLLVFQKVFLGANLSRAEETTHFADIADVESRVASLPELRVEHWLPEGLGRGIAR
jgi:hypothetical protein